MNKNINIKNFINTPIPIRKQLLSLFKRNQSLVIFDIGACEAEDSIRYSNLFPNSVIYAFEPHPENYKKALENIQFWKKRNIFIHNIALSDKTGKTILHISEGNPAEVKNTRSWDYGNKSSSILEPDQVTNIFKWLKFDKKIEVETITLKIFCEKVNINKIDFIHLDVQGAELLILAGAEHLLNSVKAVWLEVENISLYKNQPLKADVEKFMQERGFVKSLDTVNNISGDQLYINSKYKSYSINKMKRIKNKLIERFILKTNHRINFEEKSFSQCGEDMIIKFLFEILKIEINWIDIGTYHPYKYNNTATFYLRGYRGINVEPNNELFKIIKHYRPEDINLNIGIDVIEGYKDFYIMDPSTLSTFSYNEAMDYEMKYGHNLVGTKKIRTNTIPNLIDEYSQGIFPNLFCIDIEGMDEEIIKSLNLHENSPKIICAETISYSPTREGKKNNALISHLQNQGYFIYADTYINTIFVKKEVWDQK